MPARLGPRRADAPGVWRGVAAILGSVGVAGGLVAASPRQSVFQSRVDLVPVYVSVRASGDIVRGLSAKDFGLLDNGVPQQIDDLSSERVPIDVTLLVDTSSSVVQSLEVFKSDIVRISKLLQPEEQVRLITFDSRVRQIAPMQPADARVPLEAIRLGDDTSLNDGLLFALARARRHDRRHLVFVFTDGRDTSSVLDSGALLSIASRADALLHVALVGSNDAPDPGVGAHLALLAEAAERTGGALSPPAPRERDLVPAFQRAIESFRGSYVLYFSPAGVPKDGWHTLRVTVQRPGTFEIRARQGYFAN
ncbi:MAG: VWA domain-containing protein [Acidobacteria bacterium]|nr:VWA domain-containing protein [Acidobacteriota bacterium]